jgi:WD40 repeat protein
MYMGLGTSKESRAGKESKDIVIASRREESETRSAVSGDHSSSGAHCSSEEESFYTWLQECSEESRAKGITLMDASPSQGDGQEESRVSIASTVDMNADEDDEDVSLKNITSSLSGLNLKAQGEQPVAGKNLEGVGMGPGVPLSPGTVTPTSESPAYQSTQGTTKARSSHASDTSGQYPMRMSTGASSARSSFALEQADMAANRKSLEAFHRAYATQSPSLSSTYTSPERKVESGYAHVPLVDIDLSECDFLMEAGIPKDLLMEACTLAVLPPETPAPLSMLRKLWNSPSMPAAEDTMLSLAKLDLLKVAHLPDGSIWGLPQCNFIQTIQTKLDAYLLTFHRHLIRAYVSEMWNKDDFVEKGSDETLSSLDQILGNDALLKSLFMSMNDDGYIVTNLVYHLFSAQMDTTVKALLSCPDWLEKKFLSLGPAPVVSDFRRYLMFYHDPDIRLILEAFQMSVGLLMKNPIRGLLRSQITGRLLVAPLTPHGKSWLKEQYYAMEKSDSSKGNHTISALQILNPCLDQAGGVQRLCLKGHGGPVSHVIILATGSEALSASADGTVRIWDLEIGDCELVIDAHAAPITGMSVTSDGSLVVTSSRDGTVRAFELEKGTCLRMIKDPEYPVDHMILDPFGRFIITSNSHGTVTVWDLASTTAIHSSKSGSGITCMKMSSCTKYLVIGTIDGIVQCLNIESWKVMFTFEGHRGAIVALHLGPGLQKIFSACSGGILRVWSRDNTSILMNNHDGISSMYVTKSLHRAICGCDSGKARIWDLHSGSCLKVLDGHMGPINCVTMSPEEDTILTSSSDGTIIAWNQDSGEIMRVLEGHSGSVLTLALTKKGRFAVTGSEDSSLRVWDFSALNTHIPHWHVGRIRTMCQGHGLAVMTAGDDCVARIWDTKKNEYVGTFEKHTVSIRWSVLSSDGSKILTASPNREVFVWDVKEREFLYGLDATPGSRIKSFSASDDLKTAVICLFDSTVTVWDLENRSIIWCIQKWGQRDASIGHSSAVNEVMLSKDGRFVISASKDSTTRIWDIQTKTCRHLLEGHTDSVIGIRIEAACGMLLTYSLDHSLICWEFNTGKKIARFKFKNQIEEAAISVKGSIAVALSDGSTNVISPHTGDAREIRMHLGNVTGLGFTKDARYLISSSSDCSIKAVDLQEESICGVFVGDFPITCFVLHDESSKIVAGTDRGVVIFVSLPHA